MFRLYDSVSVVLVFGLILLLEHKTCISEKIRYISTEHPEVTYIDNKYISYFNLTSRRYGRGNPLYYVGLHGYFVWPFHNNMSHPPNCSQRNWRSRVRCLNIGLPLLGHSDIRTYECYRTGVSRHRYGEETKIAQVDFYFYEFLTNRYKRSFVEMHFKFCDLIHKDPFFGAAMKQGKFNQPCPFPAGAYHLYNMTIPLKQIPFNFPFTKGRIQANVTVTATRELIAFGHIDMEIKEVNLGRRKKGKSFHSEV